MKNTMPGVSQEIQQWVRIVFYLIWGGLANYGINVSSSNREIIISTIGVALTVAWTVWGSSMTNLLERVKAKAGVEEVEVKVDPDQVNPVEINKTTSGGIVAAPAPKVYPNG